MTGEALLNMLAYLGACIVLFIIGKLVYHLFNPKIKVAWELVENDNLAFSLSYAGYFTGLVIAIGGSIVGPSYGLVEDLKLIGMYGGLSILLLNISIFINDWLILRKFSVKKEILTDKNEGTGIVQAAVTIATGLIIYSAVSGQGGGIHTAIGYWAIGQVVFILISFIYDLITPYSIHEHIEKDNVAVGVGFAGALVAFGIIINHALSGDFFGWEFIAEDVLIELGIGIVLLPILRFIADVVLLPGQKLTDELINQEKPNIGAAVIEAFVYIGSAIFVTWSL